MILTTHSRRRMAVLRPLKVVIDNYPNSQVEEMDAVNNPEDPNAGTRKIPFSKVVYIEQDDFRETPPPKYYRLFPGNEVRLRYAYLIKCTHVVKNDKGEVVEVHCTYDPATAAAMRPMDAKSSPPFIGSLPRTPSPSKCGCMIVYLQKKIPKKRMTFINCLNPNSLEILNGVAEPLLSAAKAGDRFQFERQGYFCADPDSTPDKPVFNLTVSLKDTWAKIEKKDK